MDKILDFIFTSIPKDANPITIFLFVLFALSICFLFRANMIYDLFVEKFSKRELSTLRDLLADENISEKAKRLLRYKIDLIAYKRVTKIKKNKYWQKKIINCYELAEGRLRYSDFKRAFKLNFLNIDKNSNLEIRKPNIVEWILIICATVAAILVLVAFLLLLYLLIFVAMSIQNTITILLLTMFSLFLLLIYLFPVSSIFAANRIKKEIKEIKSKQYNLKNKHLRPYGLCEGKFTVPDDFGKEKELGASLSNLSTQQLSLVHQFINTLKEIPETNEDIDRLVEHHRQQNKLLPIGLAKEKFTVPDDFDDPLPDEILDLFEPK
jgi:membrane protein implicated in regulation of membrane protease activity